MNKEANIPAPSPLVRYVKHRDESNKAMVVVAPPYERVAGSVIESTKEYEVQVSHK